MMTMQIKKMIFEQHPVKWWTAYICADMEENNCKRKGNEKDGRENKINKGNKKAKFGNRNKAKNKGSENLW
eukprot:5099565-Ditylum_brightwellii.AAC.1